MKRWRGVTRSLTRRGDTELVQHLRAQIDAALEGAQLATAAVRGDLSAELARRQMVEVEHRGDEHRSRTVLRLSTSFANPIDREDLFRLSRSIDDVLDNLRDFVRELDLFRLAPQHHLEGILEVIQDALSDLDGAVLAICEDPTGIRAASLAVRKNEIRRRYQVAVADLLDGQVDGDTLKGRELLRRLDVVGLRVGEAADALADGAMKRSH